MAARGLLREGEVMTDTIRLMRQSQDQITGADLLATWSERLGGNVGMSLNESLKWVQANGGIDAVLAEAERALAEAELATATANAANAAAAPAVDTTYTMRLEVSGTSLTCRVNGAIVIGPVTNSEITGAGWAGIRNGTASTSVNGARWQRFAAGV